MDNNRRTAKILSASNYSLLTISPFVATYIEKLIYDVITYVDDDIKVDNIEIIENYSIEAELSQEITGVPSAYSAIDGSADSLAGFAEKYSHLGITEFNLLAREAIIDFLNLHNGLFVVDLSKNKICELSLGVPKQNGNYSLDYNKCKSITVIPIMFSFGIIKFLLCEL